MLIIVIGHECRMQRERVRLRVKKSSEKSHEEFDSMKKKLGKSSSSTHEIWLFLEFVNNIRSDFHKSSIGRTKKKHHLDDDY